ncbi:MAG: hypothetical protein KCHDKBKB_00684 [Elusimicrobia bacterium]|nr:hypothetical protein [Elusimicrobiota bacterium]
MTIYQQLQELYLEWVNDYLTIDKFALDHGLTPNEGFRLVQGLKKMFDSQ